MDLRDAIQDLYEEKAKLDRAIGVLMDLQRNAGGQIPPPPKSEERRGRKSMGAKEREEVSARMKQYWASRRQQGAKHLTSGA
jgi:hypothetical protein